MRFPRSTNHYLLAMLIFGLASMAAVRAQNPSPADQSSSRDHVIKGNYLLGRRLFAESIAEYEQASKLDPGNSPARENIVLAHNNWGILNFSQKNYEEAYKQWQTALKLEPSNGIARYNINILKLTMQKQGLTFPPEGVSSDNSPANVQATAAKAPPPKKEAPSAVIILNKNIKQTEPAGSNDSYDQPSSKASSEPSSTSAAESPSSPSPESSITPAAVILPVQTTSRASSASTEASTGSGSTNSLEDLLAQVEEKIYGHKQEDMPVLKRLEKLETDSTGKVQSGTIKDRIDSLRHSYGM